MCIVTNTFFFSHSIRPTFRPLNVLSFDISFPFFICFLVVVVAVSTSFLFCSSHNSNGFIFVWNVETSTLGSIFIEHNMNTRFKHMPTLSQIKHFALRPREKMCCRNVPKTGDWKWGERYFKIVILVLFDLPPVRYPFEHILPCPSYLRPVWQSTWHDFRMLLVFLIQPYIYRLRFQPIWEWDSDGKRVGINGIIIGSNTRITEYVCGGINR